MSDPIKAALDAAVTGYDMGRVLSHGGDWTRDQMSPANRAAIRPMIADAIGQFFEALPPGWHMDKSRDDIAAAVEEAARHD